MPAFFILVPIAVAVVGLLIWWFSDKRKIKRALRNAERVAIADYPHGGLKRIVGRLSIEGNALQAPLSGRWCAAYEVIVQEL